MMFNRAGLQIIKESEGCSLVAYLCPRGRLTIGYGSTFGVTQGMTITQEEAEARLAFDLERTVQTVKKMLPSCVNDNQFSAIISLAFNIGTGNFSQSTLLNSVKKLRWDDAAEEFLKWVKVNGVVSEGLVRRREKERALFLTPVQQVPESAAQQESFL